MNTKCKMPKWMKKYAKYISPGTSLMGSVLASNIEELINDHNTDLSNNSIRAIIISQCHSRIALLEQLHKDNIL